MQNGYMIFITVFCLALVVRYMILKFGKPAAYDERQLVVRGRAYKYGYLTTILLNLAFLLILMADEGMQAQKYAPGFLSISFFGGLVVFLVYSIWNDAFLSFNQKRTGYMLLCAVAAACQFFNFFRHDDWRDLSLVLQQGDRALNLCSGAAFVIALAMLLVKPMLSKADEEE